MAVSGSWRSVTAIVGVTLLAVSGFAASTADAGSSAGGGASVAGSTDVGGFVPVTPTRILDTRTGLGAPKEPLIANELLDVQVAGVAGLPTSGVGSIVGELTVTSPTASGNPVVSPSGQPYTSEDLTFTTGQTLTNQVIVPVSSSGQVSIWNRSAGTANYALDVFGYFASDANGDPAADPGAFVPLGLQRILDTRTGLGAPQLPVAAHKSITLKVTGVGGVPAANVSAVVLNVTVSQQPKRGSLSIYPWSSGMPTGYTNLSFDPARTTTAMVTETMNPSGQVILLNRSGAGVHLIADVVGYYLGGSASAAGMYVPMNMNSVLNTLRGSNSPLGPLAPGESFAAALWDEPVRPSDIGALILTVSATDPTAHGSVTLSPAGPSAGATAVLSFHANGTVINQATVGVGANAAAQFFNESSGTVQIAAQVQGYYLSADTNPGNAWSWGDTLAHGSNADSVTPAHIVGISDVSSIAGGNSTYALRSDGTVWAWGINNDHQLGDGTSTERDFPVQVSGLTNITAIAAGSDNGYALKSDGTVMAWGSNGLGEDGDGTTVATAVPVPVTGLTGVIAIAGGSGTGYALEADGTVWAWGYNNVAQLGNGTLTNSTVPTQVRASPGSPRSPRHRQRLRPRVRRHRMGLGQLRRRATWHRQDAVHRSPRARDRLQRSPRNQRRRRQRIRPTRQRDRRGLGRRHQRKPGQRHHTAGPHAHPYHRPEQHHRHREQHSKWLRTSGQRQCLGLGPQPARTARGWHPHNPAQPRAGRSPNERPPDRSRYLRRVRPDQWLSFLVNWSTHETDAPELAGG